MRILYFIKTAAIGHTYLTALASLVIIGASGYVYISHTSNLTTSIKQAPQHQTVTGKHRTQAITPAATNNQSVTPTVSTTTTYAPFTPTPTPIINTPTTTPTPNTDNQTNNTTTIPVATPVNNTAECASIKSQEQAQVNPLYAQIRQDETSMTGESNFISDYSTEGAGSGITTQQLYRAQQDWQNNDNQVNADFAQIKSIYNTFNTQLLTAHC